MANLAVIPSDPMAAYEAVGCHVWAERYYNPGAFFENTYLLSPLEKNNIFQYGMQTIPTHPHELKSRLKELKIDVIRAYGGYWPCDMACNHKLACVPVVVSVHDTNPAELHNSIRKADYVFCVSEAVRDLVLTRFPHPERTWILPNRYDGTVMRPLVGEDFSDLDKQHPWRYKLLCVGRLSKQKNQDNLIRALKILGSDYGCLFIGRNDPKDLLELAHDLGVVDQCHFQDSVRNDLLARYYNWADAMVTPSRWEGFGIVFVEALACGAVVLTSEVKPMTEYIRHEENGLLLKDFENPEAMANLISEACCNQILRRKLKHSAPESVLNFEQGKIDSLEVDYYQRILIERNNPRPMRIPLLSKLFRPHNPYQDLPFEEAALQRALDWVHRNTIRNEGICINSLQKKSYPEVTGYFIPTLLSMNEEALAVQYVKYLLRIQNEDGSWNGPTAEGHPYTFDSGQILKGLIAIHPIMQDVAPALLKGCDWLETRVGPAGAISTPTADALQMADGSRVPDAFHLYTLEPLKAAADLLAQPQYAWAVTRALKYYKQNPSLAEFTTLSHFHAYILEALIDLGEVELAQRAMLGMEKLQNPDGSIPGYRNVKWICSTGVAQYALIWLKLGNVEPARKAFNYLCQIQNPSGGFCGSYGPGANYFPEAEISWAVKYFLDVGRRLKGLS